MTILCRRQREGKWGDGRKCTFFRLDHKMLQHPIRATTRPPPPRVTHRHRLTVAGPPRWRRQRLIRATSHVAPVSAAPPGNINAARGNISTATESPGGGTPDGGASALSGLPSHVAPVSAAPPGDISGPRWPPGGGLPDGGGALSGLPHPRSPGKRSATGDIFGCGGPPVAGTPGWRRERLIRATRLM
jgi:hypothetical protein